MSRIRSIKPEFFASEQVVECSTNARLLFIGLWCFCDDAGIHPASTKRLKMEVFPADAFTDDEVRQWMDELKNVGLIETYKVEDADYWRVTGWSRHQRIDRPTFRHPAPKSAKIGDSSPNDQRALDENSASPRDGMESNGVESKGSKPVSDDTGSPQPTADDPNAASRSKDQDTCPHQQIIDLYHELLPSGRHVRAWNETRKAKLRTRWREDTKRQNLAWWRKLFAYIARSDFLTGRTSTSGRQPFELDLEWIVTPANFVKIIEGKYDNRAAA